MAMAALVAACAGPGSSGSGASHASSGPSAEKLSAWEAEQPQYDALGTVAYAGELVVTADTGVYAYDRATGKPLWRVKPSAAVSPNGVFCGSGQNAPGGMLPVGIGKLTNPGSHEVACGEAGLVNLKTGKLAWAQPVPTRAAAKGTVVPPDGIVTEFNGSTVVAGWDHVASGFSAAGKRLWTLKYNANVDDVAVANGQFYLSFDIPDAFGGEAPVAIDGLSAATGKITSRLHLTSRITHTGEPALGAFVSTDPMTVLVTDDSDAERASYLVLNPADRHVAKVIPAGAQFPGPGRHILDAGSTGGTDSSHPYVRTIVAAGKLISVTSRSRRRPQRLVAYDLSTGARSWAAVPPRMTMVAPVAVEGSTVIATALGVTSNQPMLVRMSLGTGKVLSATPRPVGEDALSTLFYDYHFTWADGRVYAVDWNQASPLSGVPELFTMSAHS